MQIEITETAARQIEKKAADRPFALKLIYDTEGCGCAVNGVPNLWLVSPGDLTESDRKAENPSFDVYVDRLQEVFFEDKMRIGFAPNRQAFSLDSDNQTYSTHMSLQDRRQ